MDISGQNLIFIFGHFSVFLDVLGAQMVKLSPISCSFGLDINIKVNVGQNKFEVRISKHVAKIANLWAKIGQLPLWRDAF